MPSRGTTPDTTDEAPESGEPDTAESPAPVSADVAIEFRGATFTIPRRRGRWPTEAIRLFQVREEIPGIYELLGEKQWRQLCAVAPYGEDVDEFVEALRKVSTEEVIP